MTPQRASSDRASSRRREGAGRRRRAETQFGLIPRAMIAAALANLGEGRPGKTASIDAVPISQPDAAEMMGVARRSVQRAMIVDGREPEERWAGFTAREGLVVALSALVEIVSAGGILPSLEAASANLLASGPAERRAAIEARLAIAEGRAGLE